MAHKIDTVARVVEPWHGLRRPAPMPLSELARALGIDWRAWTQRGAGK